MRSLIVFVVCLAFAEVYSAVINDDQVEIPGHEGQCYDKDQKTFYNKGDVMRSDGPECIQINCLGLLPETGKIRIQTLTCGTVKAGPGCSITQDLSKPYPDCCPQIVAMPSVQSEEVCEPEQRERE